MAAALKLILTFDLYKAYLDALFKITFYNIHDPL